MHKTGYVYIMTSPFRNALYVGVTSELAERVWKHKNKYYPESFTAKYNCSVLVYYCCFDNILDAIAEEKRIKTGNRKQKENLIISINPEWKDLSDGIF